MSFVCCITFAKIALGYTDWVLNRITVRTCRKKTYDLSRRRTQNVRSSLSCSNLFAAVSSSSDLTLLDVRSNGNLIQDACPFFIPPSFIHEAFFALRPIFEFAHDHIIASISRPSRACKPENRCQEFEKLAKIAQTAASGVRLAKTQCG